jgi:endonuclease-8
MPEGHSIRRYADEHWNLMGGMTVTASSPQGRFAAGAARISGRKLLAVDTHGKHLFYRWHRAESLHVHLGLYGRFRSFRGQAPPPTPATRLSLQTDAATIYLAGPSTCELITPSQEETIMQRLGPDPLKTGLPGNTVDDLQANLARRTIPIGAALIEQAVISGLGNIYRSEVLFLTGIHPFGPASSLNRREIDAIWSTSCALLARGVAEGRITTVDRVPTRSGDATERLYVYGRERFPCRSCAGPISSAELADRRIWWCDTCQRLGAPP